MIGLRSQFGLSLALIAITVALSLVVAALVGRRHYVARGSWLRAAARVLALGAVIVTIVATALPQRLGIETDGDLVLALGRGGLGEWRHFFDDPTSLASIELMGNVLLYVAVGCTMVIGWYPRRRLVLPMCLALSLSIETAQYLVLGRVAALDDVLLNGVGATLGYVFALVLIRFLPGERRVAVEPAACVLG